MGSSNHISLSPYVEPIALAELEDLGKDGEVEDPAAVSGQQDAL